MLPRRPSDATTSAAAARSRLGLLPLCATAALLLTAVAVWWLSPEFRALCSAWHERASTVVTARADLFFISMAVLPALGAPLLPFNLAAGTLVAPELGAAPTLLLGAAALATNALLGYGLAANWLRPWTARLLRRFGRELPSDLPIGPWHLVAAVRVVPALPYWTQSFLLGVLRVPLTPYLVLSTLVPWCYLVGCVLLGEAAKGRPPPWLLALGAIGLVALVIKGWRGHRASATPG